MVVDFFFFKEYFSMFNKFCNNGPKKDLTIKSILEHSTTDEIYFPHHPINQTQVIMHLFTSFARAS